MIYLTSDLHFCHNKEFVFLSRGFTNIEEHDKAILNNWNSIVNDNDDVYILGDLMLNDNEKALQLIKQLKGKLHIVLGNHDTNTKVALYKTCDNIVEICYATLLKYKGKIFYLSHYPTITSKSQNIENRKNWIYNLYGHTHQQTNFYEDNVFMYHVGLDSHNNYVVSLDQIIEDCDVEVIKKIEKENENENQ